MQAAAATEWNPILDARGVTMRVAAATERNFETFKKLRAKRFLEIVGQ